MTSMHKILTFALMAAIASACGSTDEAPDSGSASQDTGPAVVDAGLDAGASDASPSDTGADDAGLAVGAPVLLSVSVPSHGTMSLSWQNPNSGCTTIDISRKMNLGAYVPAKTVTGVATETTDQPGHANGTYCYTLVCNLNGVASTPSNERCATQ